LLLDNPPAHKAASVCQFLNKKIVTTLYHRHPSPSDPYSPDSSPPEYFLFPKLKMKLKRLHFAHVAEIQEDVTDELKTVQKEERLTAFQKTYDRTKACIYANGAYCEKKKRTVFSSRDFDLKKNFWTALCILKYLGRFFLELKMFHIKFAENI
jgi:histone-lysine N-methyltransferase SETMAR